MTVNGLRLGLIGFPLEHSLSPPLHQAALQSTGLIGEYRLYPVPTNPESIQQLRELVDMVRRQEIHGLNVTIPYKEEIMVFLDELTTTARAIGAANTVAFFDGQVLGDNTDASGFWADLTRLFPVLVDRPSTALLLGAGGAARAVAFALLQSGWKVIVAARRIKQAQELINNFSSTPEKASLEAVYLPSSGVGEWKVSRGVALIVNTTPVGMSPHTSASPWPQGIRMPEGAFVYDLVYNPAQTLLVRQARQAGLMAASGLGMLVEQAALAFERWTGLYPDRQVMYQAASQYLG
jgi:shikimate dehydrogenase